MTTAGSTIATAFVELRPKLASSFAGDLKSQVTAPVAEVGKAVVGLAIGAKIASEFKKGFDELEEGQKVAAQTGAVLKSTGGIAGVTAQEISGLASELSNMSGQDDEAVQSMENLLLTFKNIRNNGPDKTFDEASRAALDLSVAFGKDLQSSAILVGKALDNPLQGLTALTRVGVTFTQSQKDTVAALVETGKTADAQKLILAELESQVGGSAKAYGETLPGQIAKANVAIDNARGSLVAGLAPALEIGAKGAEFLAKEVGGLPAPLQTSIGLVGLLGGAVVGLARPVSAMVDLLGKFGVGQREAAVATLDVTAATEANDAAQSKLALTQGRSVLANVALTEAQQAAAAAATELAAAEELAGAGSVEAATATQALVIAEAELGIAQGKAAAAGAALTAQQATAAATADALAVSEEAAAVATEGFEVSLGAIGAVLAVAAVGMSLFSRGSDGAKKAAQSLDGPLKQLGHDFTDLSQHADLNIGNFVKGLSESNAELPVVLGNTVKLNDALSDAGLTTSEFTKLVSEGTATAKEWSAAMAGNANFTGQDALALQGLTNAINDQAKAALEAAAVSGAYTDEQRQLISTALTSANATGQYAKVLGDVEGALGGSINATGDLVGAVSDVPPAMSAAKLAAKAFEERSKGLTDTQNALADALDRVASGLKAAYGQTLDPVKLAEDLAAATDDLVASLKENGVTLDIDTEKGRANTDAVLAAGEAVAALIAQKFKETGSLQDAQAAGAEYVAGLEAQLAAAGYNQTQIQSMIDTMNLTPADIATTFSTNSPEIQAIVDDLKSHIEAVPVEWQSTFIALVDAGKYAEAQALLDDLAADRISNYFPQVIYGPGGSTPKFASGGLARAGMPVFINDPGPQTELVIPGVDSYVMAAARVKELMAGYGMAGAPGGATGAPVVWSGNAYINDSSGEPAGESIFREMRRLQILAAW